MGKVEIKNITRAFRKEGVSETLALDNVSLGINDKEFICFVGPSGCGKTTLLRIIAGLDNPDSGEILLDGVKVSIPDSKRGMVFQEYSLFPWRTVAENITFGPEMKGVSRKQAIKETEKYLELVGLTQFKDSFPYELSGGMRQRVAIARALANEPEVLLMDEPFGALDAQTRNSLQHQLLDIWNKKHITILFVTHSVDEAVFLADRIVVMTARPGKIKEIIDVDLPRPRIRTGPEANKLRTSVLKLLSEERKERIDYQTHSERTITFVPASTSFMLAFPTSSSSFSAFTKPMEQPGRTNICPPHVAEPSIFTSSISVRSLSTCTSPFISQCGPMMALCACT